LLFRILSDARQRFKQVDALEEPSLMVGELDDDGYVDQCDQYDLDRLDEAPRRCAQTTALA